MKQRKRFRQYWQSPKNGSVIIIKPKVELPPKYYTPKHIRDISHEEW